VTEIYKEMACCGAKQVVASFTNILSFIDYHVIRDVDDDSDDFTMDNEVYLLHLGWIMRTFET
jgi:hypothetical protein